MESEQQSIDRNRALQPWTSCKLIIDPLLTNGLYKVYRYDGQFFNIPVDDLGVFPLETVRDPRICRPWSKNRKSTGLTVPKFKIDECYVGPIPPKEVTFARLNDNVKEAFLTEMCKKYGEVDEVEIFYNPKTIKHLGIGKVIFSTVKAAKDTVQHLHKTSVMGNIIHVEVDPKGENRKRYLKLLVDGLYTSQTLPVGSNEQSLSQESLRKLPGCKPPERETFVCSPISISTPLTLDTAYSSIYQDTPQSSGLTPHSQGTPCTPYLSGTPLSQDSCYSSLQATPVHQGEPLTHTVHTVSRQEVYSRKTGRHNARFRKGSYLRYIFKDFQPQPLLPPFNQTLGNNSSLQPTSCTENLPPSNGDPLDPSLNFLPASAKGDVATTLSLKYCSPSLQLITNGFSDQEDGTLSPPLYHPSIDELPLASVNASPGGPRDESESLDSRIEMLLNKNRSAGGDAFSSSSFFVRHGTEGVDEPQEASAAHPFSKDSPASNLVSVDLTWTSGGSLTPSHHPVSASQSPLPVHEDNEDDETVKAVASLFRDIPPFTSSPLTNAEKRMNTHHGPSVMVNKRLRSQDFNVNQDKMCTASTRDAVFSSKGTSALPPPLSFLPKANLSQMSVPFRFPHPSIPPSTPLFPLRLPNGTIPFPPPCWFPPPSLGNPKPSPSIPPPPLSFLRPHPRLPAAAAPPGHSYCLHGPPTKHLGKPSLPGGVSTPWSSLPLPCFNPFMPPPGYMPMREDSHIVTVEKVLQVLVEEIRSIIKKDIMRKMVEAVAFKAFEQWWDDQEQKSKMFDAPLKTGTGRPEQRAKPQNPLCQIIGQHKPTQLPSFKVKRKEALHPYTLQAAESTHPISHPHQQNGPSENPELEKLCNADKRKLEEAGISRGGGHAPLRRRHARPLLLDSDNEAEEVGNARKNKNEIVHGEEEGKSSQAVRAAPLTQCYKDDCDKMEKKDVQMGQMGQTEGKEVILSSVQHFFDSGSPSEVGSSFWEDSDGSSVSHSESSECFSGSGSSDRDLSSDEDDNDCKKQDTDEGYIVISSDEERMDLDSPATPQTPLTPGARLELPGPPEWSVGFEGKSSGNDQYLLDPVLEIYPACQHQCPLQSHFMQELKATFGLPMNSPEWRPQSPATLDNLRPPTPTGSVGYSDLDILMGSKSTPPAVEEAERPHTPGRGITGEDSADELLLLPPTVPLASHPVPSPSSELHALYPMYQERPKTPGTEEWRGWGLMHSSTRVPATPGGAVSPSEVAMATRCSPLLSSPLPLPSLCSQPYTRTPRTPGRDIVLRNGPPTHRRRRRRRGAMGERGVQSLGGSSPPLCFLSDSSVEARASKGPRLAFVATSKPLQGLENMPGLLHLDGQRRPCQENWGQWRWQRERRERRKRRRRWAQQRRRKRSFVCSPCWSPPWSRSQCEETEVLHSVWRYGLDDEDARLLLLSHQRLLHRDNGLGWLSDTLWVPHPLTSSPAGSCEDRDPEHATGCARSEGFYTISRTDKLKYLNETQLALEPPATSALGVSMSANLQSSLRAGSDFRSEQRRLLSSFSCDSDLVKFNQLKFRKKRIRFARSHIHDWGLFAMEQIAADELVIEYVGQTIRQVIADMREKRYEDQGIGSSYLFRVDQDTIIDATKCGNLARFINHSCNPNCYAKIITVESQKKIVIYSRQPIGINEEITYDYKFPIEDEKIPCLCGADGCHGTLN